MIAEVLSSESVNFSLSQGEGMSIPRSDHILSSIMLLKVHIVSIRSFCAFWDVISAQEDDIIWQEDVICNMI